MMDELTEGTVAMRLNQCRATYSLAAVAVLGVVCGVRSTEAGSIKPWSGASASIQVLDKSQSDSGTSASVATSGTGSIEYQSGGYAGLTDPGHIYSAGVQGSASAQATGQADDLLQLGASYTANNPGTNPILYQNPSVSASASWTGDSLQLTAPGGNSLPDHIELDFLITYQPLSFANQWFNASPPLTFQVNGTTVTLDGTTLVGFPYQYTGPLALDSFTYSKGVGDFEQDVEAAFHLDLPIDAHGVSSPINLALSADVANGLVSNGGVSSYLKDVNLSLSDITLPDGTSVTHAGYGVSFASGMAWPQPNAVPEPASVAVWTGLAAAGWWVVRKKRRIA